MVPSYLLENRVLSTARASFSGGWDDEGGKEECRLDICNNAKHNPIRNLDQFNKVMAKAELGGELKHPVRGHQIDQSLLLCLLRT